MIGASVLTHASLAASADLAALLAGGSLAEIRNPVAANYLLEEGAPRLSEAERAAALDQLRDALRSQTNVMALAMQGVGGMLSSDAMRDGMQAAKKLMGPGALLGGLAGIAPAVPMPAPGQMEREMKQAMVEPWVRGIAAARALEKAGEVQAAARFYVNCRSWRRTGRPPPVSKASSAWDRSAPRSSSSGCSTMPRPCR